VSLEKTAACGGEAKRPRIEKNKKPAGLNRAWKDVVQQKARGTKKYWRRGKNISM
jgi:hypothetical protein